jgi:indolepyruvate ferredoxin oxidoreductase alpha subunit
MSSIAKQEAGTYVLLLGNEAIARGALEGGAQFCAGYPGTPSTEIVGTLATIAKDIGIHVEWSVNEKVATEVAAAAAFSGLRGLVTMKNAGASVAMDFLMHLNLTGIGDRGGGLLVVVCDDPQAHASGDEVDTRWIAQMADVPLLEPGSVQEAKDLTKWAFELSAEFKSWCFLRSYTRLSHSRSGVKLGEISKPAKKAMCDTTKNYSPYFATPKHASLHDKLVKLEEIFESSSFNSYAGPEQPELLIICSGSGWACSLDAVETLNLSKSVGILKLATLWPFPKGLVTKYLTRTARVLVVEEVDPFVELHVKEAVFAPSAVVESLEIYGKGSGHINYFGEITPDAVINALCRIFNLDYRATGAIQDAARRLVIDRGMVWCPGCPHRATFFALGNAIRRDGRNAVVSGDIGCYTLDIFPDGPHLSNVLHCMGSGAGEACGFGELAQFGFEQPSIGICGDSTFFHASIPALINAVYNRSKITLIVLDNGATAMTGFQPHPGTGYIATGEETVRLNPEEIAKACGVKFVEAFDPFDLKNATNTIEKAIVFDGPAVVISRGKCALLAQREKKQRGEKTIPYHIDRDKCSKCLVAKDKVMPCSAACPAGNDIPAFLNLVKQGKFNEGLESIKQSNPLPAVLGRVCYHPCEADCNRGQLDKAIANRLIERFLGDYGLSLPSVKKETARHGEKVAIIGSGPAGLSCAYHLTMMSYPVTAFEALPVPGGMLRVGIPEYRLPKDVLSAEIKRIEDLGVDIRLNTTVTSINQLMNQGYKAVFVAAGAHKDMKLGIPGEEKTGVLSATGFLREVNLGKAVGIGDRVIVVGGGNVAIDSARVAIRQGAKQASIVYRRSRAEMPASDEEIEAAEEEGIKITYLAVPTKVLGDGKVTGMECTRMELGEPDANGRARPIPIKGSEFVIGADTVIVAIGQIPALTFADKELQISAQNTLIVDPDTLATNKPGVFAGGDVVTGPATVADAVGTGKRAAVSIDRYLRGKPLNSKEKKRPVVSFEELHTANLPLLPKAKASRVQGFAEVEDGLTPDVATVEAQRCLSCGPFSEKCIMLLYCPAIIRDKDDNTLIDSSLCNGCGVCADICPYKAIAKEKVE